MNFHHSLCSVSSISSSFEKKVSQCSALNLKGMTPCVSNEVRIPNKPNPQKIFMIKIVS